MSVDYIHISSNEIGQRLDNFLLKKLKGVPRSLIYKIIRSGQVRINKGRTKASYRLSEKDIVRIPPIETSNNSTGISYKFLNNLEKYIIFENQDFIILDKPAKIAVHSGTGLKNDIISSIKTIKEYRNITPVHRLDKDTSGCLILAKNYQSASFFGSIMPDIKKTYNALLFGRLSKKEVKIDKALTDLRKDGNRKIITSSSGKPASSIFIKKKQYKKFTLVDVILETGRTHQIRVHAANMNNPICGDKKYGDKELNRELNNKGLDRIFLHAEKISFYYNKKYSFKSKLPLDLLCVLDNIKEV